MKIKYIGHSTFLLTTSDGTRIITDPYEPGSYDGAVKYKPVGEEADIVLVSHGHPDHNHVASISGKFEVVDQPGEVNVGSVALHGIPTYHDTSEGSERGENIIFRIVADGFTVCHLGDLGHTLGEGIAADIKPVDVLFLPVGGFYAVGSEEADSLIASLEPKLVIPMHFKTEGADFPIAPVDDFLSGRKGVQRPGGSEVELSVADLPEGILVLEPANLP
jgi:L-ascorbate metabolism protein UlaG (beta-lactamase superfamily)